MIAVVRSFCKNIILALYELLDTRLAIFKDQKLIYYARTPNLQSLLSSISLEWKLFQIKMCLDQIPFRHIL